MAWSAVGHRGTSCVRPSITTASTSTIARVSRDLRERLRPTSTTRTVALRVETRDGYEWTTTVVVVVVDFDVDFDVDGGVDVVDQALTSTSEHAVALSLETMGSRSVDLSILRVPLSPVD